MSGAEGWVRSEAAGDGTDIRIGGDWTLETAQKLDVALRGLTPPSGGDIRIDLTELGHLDTAGAWLLHRTRKEYAATGREVFFVGARDGDIEFLDRIASGDPGEEIPRERFSPFTSILVRVGQGTEAAWLEAADLLNFLGATVVTAARVAVRPKRIRLVAFFSHLEQVGLNALPIVGLLSFLIGIVIAYQGADQLRRLGAELFTIDLLGVSVLRELGIILAAIIVAGRSGSAFTAQIGTMQVNEEVDAMRTIGLDPMEVLVLPRVFALVVAMPLLAVFANVMGLLGGLIMVDVVLGIGPVRYLQRLQEVVPIWAFWVGLIKAPVFGALIALVGCREGLKVSGSAESVGRQTTKSVVVSIFLVIVVDAAFSIFFSTVGV